MVGKADIATAIRWSSLLLVLSAFLLYGLDCYDHASSGRPVSYVVPDGFRGRIRLISDPAAPPVPLVHGVYVVTVPPSGYLHVRDLGFTTRWHYESARYRSGTRIPTDPEARTEKWRFVVSATGVPPHPMRTDTRRGSISSWARKMNGSPALRRTVGRCNLRHSCSSTQTSLIGASSCSFRS